MNELGTRVTSGIIGGVLFFGAYTFAPMLFSLILVALLFLILVLEWPRLFKINSVAFWLIMPFYPVLPVLCLIYLHYTYYYFNFWLPLYPYLTAWIFDSGGYHVGSAIGRHKITPRISPGKTWEGFVGGFVALFIFNYAVLLGEGIVFIGTLTLIFGTLAFFGDLFVSYLKRRVGLKDTSALIPGHGGLLDRFDSVFFVATGMTLLLFVWEYLTSLLWSGLVLPH